MSNVFSRSARLALAVILLALTTTIYLFFWSDSAYKYEPAQNPTGPPVNSSSRVQAPTNPWCEPDECARGRWLPREPGFKTLEDFRAAFANRQDQVWKGCRAYSQKPLTPEEQHKADEERLMKVMDWTWTPYMGHMRAWNAEEFVIRLLRSPGGLILIGDSISQQHHHALGYILRQADLRFDPDLPNLPMYSHKNVHYESLKPDDPKTKDLLQRSGVPSSRLERPVLTMFEDHMLIGESDIRSITERLGASKDYFWYHDFQRVEEWEGLVKNASKPRPGEEDSVREDTILLINAGAHWSRHELAMLPPRGTDLEEQARVKETFRGMINLVTSQLAPIPRLSVYYRATSPGHPACEASGSTPYPNEPMARLAERDVAARLQALVDTDDLKKQRRRWDWDLFTVHNEMWRARVGRLAHVREGKESGARWFYMDVWDQSLQRPDAHSEPGQDCLHWCMPSVLNLWTEHLHHLLSLEGEDF